MRFLFFPLLGLLVLGGIPSLHAQDDRLPTFLQAAEQGWLGYSVFCGVPAEPNGTPPWGYRCTLSVRVPKARNDVVRLEAGWRLPTSDSSRLAFVLGQDTTLDLRSAHNRPLRVPLWVYATNWPGQDPPLSHAAYAFYTPDASDPLPALFDLLAAHEVPPSDVQYAVWALTLNLPHGFFHAPDPGTTQLVRKFLALRQRQAFDNRPTPRYFSTAKVVSGQFDCALPAPQSVSLYLHGPDLERLSAVYQDTALSVGRHVLRLDYPRVGLVDGTYRLRLTARGWLLRERVFPVPDPEASSAD